MTEFEEPSVYLATSLATPEGTYSFQYEQTPGSTGNVSTGRIESITLPTGGTIQYAYSGGNNGINCSSQVVPTITRTVNDNNGNINTWTFVNNNTTSVGSTTPANFTVVETDPAHNQTIHTFTGEYQTQVMTYQGGCPTSTPGCSGGTASLLSTSTTCYNGNFSSCATWQPEALPSSITQTDTYTSYNGSSSNNLVETVFSFSGDPGEVKQYDFGVTMGAAPTVNPVVHPSKLDAWGRV